MTALAETLQAWSPPHTAPLGADAHVVQLVVRRFVPELALRVLELAPRCSITPVSVSRGVAANFGYSAASASASRSCM